MQIPDLIEFGERFRIFLEKHILAGSANISLPLGRDIYEEAGQQEFFKTNLPVSLGGFDSPKHTMILLQALGQAAIPGFSFWVHSEIFCYLLVHFGSQSLIKTLIPLCSEGKLIGCVGFTEPTGGSMLSVANTYARETQEGYFISGRKACVSLGSFADMIIITARYGERENTRLFLVDLKSPGVRLEPFANLFSMQELSMADIEFNEVFVPRNYLLAQDWKIPLLRVLTLERYICSVIAFNILNSKLEDTIAYCRLRIPNGRMLIEHQHVRLKLSQYVARYESLRGLLHLQEQRYVDRRRLDPKAIAICKVQTTETLRDFANFAVHIRGAKGVLGNPTTLKVLNDAHAQCIYGGTSETMFEIVGSSLV